MSETALAKSGSRFVPSEMLPSREGTVGSTLTWATVKGIVKALFA